MTTHKVSPATLPSFEDFTPGSILTETEAILNTSSALHDDLAAALTPAEATFANLVRPIVDDANRAACRLRILSTLLGQLSPDGRLRDAARQAEARIAAARTENLMRRDLAMLIVAVHERETLAPSEDTDTEDRHLLSYLHGEYLRSGSALQDDKARKRLRVALTDLNKVCIAAQQAFTEAEDGVWFQRADLKGVPDDVLESMSQNDNGTRLRVTFSNTHVTAVMRHAIKSETRRRLYVANQKRLPDNVKHLSQAIALRDGIARLLGYDHHAALKLEDKMALSVAQVEAQLLDLRKTLKPHAQAQTESFIQLKRKERIAEEVHVNELYPWERAYYHHKQNKDSVSLNHTLLAEYFKVEHTLKGMFGIFNDLFGITFEPIHASVWHHQVTAYEVWDVPSEGGQFLGHLYVDLFEQKGKYRGAQHILVQPGFVEATGQKHYPASALVCSFASPTSSRPALLQHSEVKTMFHELGHVIHNIVARTKYSLPHSRGFIEIPSIMLENWVWIPDVLVRLGKHYTSISEYDDVHKGALPRDLAAGVARTRNKARANDILGQVQPALFDLTIHTPPSHTKAMRMNTTEIWNKTKREVLTLNLEPNPEDWGAGQARFAHMFHKNDGSYFAYPLSIVYAADLFAAGFSYDPMSAEAGRRYRYQVLEPGASRPEMDILRDFLGREPSTKALFDELNAESRAVSPQKETKCG